MVPSSALGASAHIAAAMTDGRTGLPVTWVLAGSTPFKPGKPQAIALMRGSAISFAPIIDGTRKLPNPARTGMMNMKIISTPCIVNSVE